jgi:hypothetical protein
LGSFGVVHNLAVEEKGFEKLLLDAIDDAFLSLGESVKQSIYFHLESNFNIARKDIPRHLGDFEEGLEKIFGLGARFIEILIMKNLHAKIGRTVKWEENQQLDFAKYVEAAKQSYLNENK